MYYLYDDCGRDGVAVSGDGSTTSSSGEGKSYAVDMAVLRKAQRLGGNGQFIGFEESLAPAHVVAARRQQRTQGQQHGR